MNPRFTSLQSLSDFTQRVASTFACLAVLFQLSVAAPALSRSNLMVITWGGNSPEWNGDLHVSAIPVGCSDAAASCLRTVDQTASAQHTSSVLLAVMLNQPRILSDASAYGSASGPIQRSRKSDSRILSAKPKKSN